MTVQDRNPDFARGTFGAVLVDFLLTANPLFQVVLDRYATVHRFGDVEVPCATVEGLILLKLYALPSLYRQGDLQRAALYESDITMLTQRYHPRLGPLLKIVQQHVDPGQAAELARIVSEIEQRVLRMEGTLHRPDPGSA